MDLKLNIKESVFDKVNRLADILAENNISLNTVAYRLTREDAAVLGDEILPTMNHGIEKALLERAIEHGYAHRRLQGGRLFGIHLVAAESEKPIYESGKQIPEIK